MKRKALLLSLLMTCVSIVMAEQYKLVRGCVYYRYSENTKEAKVLPNQYIPNADVYVRMHADSRNDDTFEVSNAKGEYFTCRAPKSWPGKKLRECLEEQDIDHLFAIANAIPMGDAEIKHAPQFHYLCAFVSQFDDSHWHSFPYSPQDSINMQKAIDKVRSQQEYLRGKQYLLTSQRTTKRHIVNCMDSILQNAGENDFIFLYFSSHGEKDANGQFHFITKDSRQKASPRKFSNSLSKSEINHFVSQLTAKKARVLFFLDACYAGAVLDNDIQGEAAYYLSTNGENPAYYNKLFGSPFALALMEVMSGSLNENYAHCFTDNKVQVGSLGNYLSTAVYGKGQYQHPVCYEHALSPAYVLWQIRSSKPQESLAIRIQAEKAEKDPEEMIKLGDRYYNGDGVDVDFYKAFGCYKKASERGKKQVKAEALRKMSDCFYYGNPESDDLLAFEYSLQSAKLGNISSMYNVALFYYDGHGTKKDLNACAHWFQLAAKKGHPDAQRDLGLCYEQGYGVDIDKKKAVYWYTKSAEQGNADAQCNLGSCYEHAKGVEKNMKEAIYWYTKAAEQGNRWAQYDLGVCYYDAKGVKKDLEKAVYWYTKSAEQGHSSAQCNLGYCYEHAEGVDKNQEKAIYWYTKSAEQGNKWAQCNLGYCYEIGRGVNINLEKAAYWYTKAAEQGHARAQCNLGSCYEHAKGVEKNMKEAIYWYTKAAEQGYMQAQCYLGEAYYNGNGVTKNVNKAADYFKLSSYQGYARAQNYLGYCYNIGLGVDKDVELAFYWYEKAAMQGNATAQYNLGVCYLNGTGVPKDYDKAVEWIRKASANGNESAKTWVKKNYHGVEYIYSIYSTSDGKSSFSFFLKGDTTLNAETGAVGTKTLRKNMEDKKQAKTGAISSKGKGVIIYGANGYLSENIPQTLLDTIHAINKRGKIIIDVAMSNDMKYYCVVYDKNKYFTNGPLAFTNKLKKFSDDKDEFLSVSINDAGEYAIVTNKHFYCSNSSSADFAQKISREHGNIYSISVSNKGIVICAEDGVYFQKLPPEVYHALVRAIDISNPFIIRVVKFTDEGTCLITDGKSRNTYRL